MLKTIVASHGGYIGDLFILMLTNIKKVIELLESLASSDYKELIDSAKLELKAIYKYLPVVEGDVAADRLIDEYFAKRKAKLYKLKNNAH